MTEEKRKQFDEMHKDQIRSEKEYLYWKERLKEDPDNTFADLMVTDYEKLKENEHDT